MTYNIQNNNLYFLSVGLLCLLSYLLNAVTAIYQCALIFTLIAVTVNAITFLYSKTKALTGLAIAVFVSFTLLWKLPYYIDRKIVNSLATASFSSVMISMYWSATVFQKLEDKCVVSISTPLSLAVGALIDGLVMGLFFIMNNNFSYERVLDIFIREVSYKILYAFVAFVIIATTLNIVKNNQKQRVHAK